MKKDKTPPHLTREILLGIIGKEKRPLTFGDLVAVFDVQGKQKRELKSMIRVLVEEGKVIRLKNGRLAMPEEMSLQGGTLWCTKSGNGFLIPDKEGEKDIFIPARHIEDAFHGDRVIARIDRSFQGRKEGKVIKVTERKTRNVIGFVQRTRDLLFLVPEDQRFPQHFLLAVEPKHKDLKDGTLVACRVTRFPENGKDPEARIIHVFEGLGDVKSINQFVTYKYNLPLRFRKTTDSDVHAINPDISDAGRLDLRSLKIVTIDGEQAKDFDDAVFVEKTAQGYVLLVSIADVSHYVSPGSSLDKEAYERGTSVYFPGSVIPMLPKVLSNGLCSLNPGEDRLTLTVKLTYDRNGTVTGSSFHKSIIRSFKRLTYTAVEAALVKKDDKVRKELTGIIRPLEQMKELALLLTEQRAQRESLDFDLPEPEVVLDIEGGISHILRAERLFAHRLIEEFMIAANEAVAGFFTEKGIPAMYRIHEPPDREKLHDFEKLLQTLAIDYRRDRRGLPLQAILASVRGTPYEFLVNRVLLRSLKQAKYSAINKGHFGLSSKDYLHFTSPIRRYPDLVCHRILKQALEASGNTPLEGRKRVHEAQDRLEAMAIHLSDRERVAMEAERELEDRIRVLFMKDRIGQTHEGIISHITSYGFYVELFDIFVEGLVLLSSLHDDYYTFQEDRFRLLGRHTRKVFRIGDKVTVRVVSADVEKNQLHFELSREVANR
jgi:ribonuclease R